MFENILETLFQELEITKSFGFLEDSRLALLLESAILEGYSHHEPLGQKTQNIFLGKTFPSSFSTTLSSFAFHLMDQLLFTAKSGLTLKYDCFHLFYIAKNYKLLKTTCVSYLYIQPANLWQHYIHLFEVHNSKRHMSLQGHNNITFNV